jgi:nicotinamide phosphoribosyltransferase
MTLRPETCTDFYKTGHIKMYSKGTTFVYSNFTCRSDKLAGVLPDFDHKVVFFGLQGVLKSLNELWQKEFFSKPKEVIVARYQRRMDRSLGPGAVKVDHIAALHDLGYLPILIKALPEGSRVNMRVALWTIQNTLPEFFWLTNYLETQLSAECWKPVHSATIAYEYRRLLDFYADITGSPKAFVPWQGHDFSSRGMSNIYDAATSGSAHLLSFTGTDSISSIDYLEEYYNAYDDFIGGSVPATEHSVMSMGGKDDEIGTFRRLITEAYPSGIISIVSDTWDFWQVLTGYANTLKNEILAREPDALGFAKVVFRPDSGDPVKIIAGDPEAPVDSPEYKGAVECLWEIFGGTVTHTGHKLLDMHVGLIYGDSITLQRASRILDALHKKGFASGNVIFGIGSYTYQMATRDSFGCAVKATFGVVDGEDRVLFKEPKTGDGMKNSARGFLRIEKEGDDFVQYDMQTRAEEAKGAMEPVYCDGKILRDDNLSNIRNRLIPSL